jgi:hypothetical protein
MAYDERLADRIRGILADEAGVDEREMFGGLAVMLDGNMCCGVVGEQLMLRLGREGATEALRKPHVRPMDFTGRTISTMVFIEPQGFRGAALRRWVDLAAAHARTLAPKR